MENLPGVPEETPVYFCIGQHETKRTIPVTNLLVSQAQDAGYDMITRPITSTSFQVKVLAALDAYLEAVSGSSNPASVPYPLIAPLTPEDTNLLPDEFISSMIAVTSPWIDLASPDPVVVHISRQVFNLEVAYAAFCGVNNMIIEGPRLRGAVTVSQYARSIAQALNVGPYLNLQIRLPMTSADSKDETQDPSHMASRMREQYATASGMARTSTDALRSWDAWELIRTICKFHSRLSVALSIPQKLPDMEIQSRWFSEPLRLLEFHRSSFMRNAKGFPVLSKSVQALITRYTRLKTSPWILLTDVGSIPTDEEMEEANPTPSAEDVMPTPAQATQSNRVPKKPKQKDLTPYQSYMRHLQRTQPPRPIIDRFAAGYQDFLQSPLQPLTDNLESITYEVFEKDPVKYEWYERATAAALVDLKKTLKRDIVVAVVGAGRGPLMTRALRASASTGISILPYAVEKNPNAYVLLQNRNATDPLWGKRVKVVKTDMRAWAGPTLPSGEVGKVDILISELLGSFADNELSPECLDGVQHVLHPDHGVSIPTSYTAHFTPIASPRIYADLLGRTGAGAEDRWELPYVSMLHQFDNLCLASSADNAASAKNDKVPTEPAQPDVQQAWEFVHPIPQAIIAQSQLRRGGSVAAGFGGAVGGDGWNEHNARFCKLTFTCTNRGVCHGLGGYFETVLYESKEQGNKIELSTNPVTMDEKSKDMISWFPIFFPLKTPMYFPDQAEVEVSMWRQTDDRKVWYEWVVEVFARIGETRQRVGMSDLHSSSKNGCLM